MRYYRLRKKTTTTTITTEQKREPMPLEERIRRYLDKAEPAVSGQFGHRQTFFVARALVHGFALSKEEALPFLEQYNQRCEPPWKISELKHKLASAENWQPTSAQKPRGYLR